MYGSNDGRSIYGSGMPPSRAPRYGAQVQRGGAIGGGGGGSPQMAGQQGGGMNPMALMMLMRMLQQNGGQGGGMSGSMLGNFDPSAFFSLAGGQQQGLGMASDFANAGTAGWGSGSAGFLGAM